MGGIKLLVLEIVVKTAIVQEPAEIRTMSEQAGCTQLERLMNLGTTSLLDFTCNVIAASINHCVPRQNTMAQQEGFPHQHGLCCRFVYGCGMHHINKADRGRERAIEQAECL